MEMQRSPADFIPQFAQLLQEWTATAFPLPRTVEAAGRLNATVWEQLMNALCNHKSRLISPFLHEITQLNLSGRAGDPPIQAIEGRLRQLVEFGLRPVFIVTAARQVIDASLAEYYPDQLANWQQHADEIVPLSDITHILYSEHSGGGWKVYGPNIDD